MEDKKMTIIELKAVVEDMRYILGVSPDYSFGRRMGLKDEETEMLANKALARAEDMLYRVLESMNVSKNEKPNG
jgi:ABC-type proline/glycine betaine transport system substrate-binding protein